MPFPYTKLNSVTQSHKFYVIAILIAISCLLAFYLHYHHEASRVLTHFFYLPIVLSCFWWERKGIFVAIILSLTLIFTPFLLGQHDSIQDDLFRGISFVIVAMITSSLKLRLALVEKKNRLIEQQFYARERQRLIGKLSGGFAHSFNNRLVSILGYADLIREKTDTQSRVHDYAQKIITSSKSAEELIQQMISFSNMKESEQKPVHINRVIERSCEVSKVVTGKNISIHFHEKATEDVIAINQFTFIIGFLNLLFRQPESHLDRRTIEIKTAQHHSSTVQKNGFVSLTIIDDMVEKGLCLQGAEKKTLIKKAVSDVYDMNCSLEFQLCYQIFSKISEQFTCTQDDSGGLILESTFPLLRT